MLKRQKTNKDQDCKETASQEIDRKENPVVSVIVPVYNCEKHLPVMLHQIKEQNFSDFEAICVDDGSTDGSFSILEDFAARDPRFKAMKHKGKGASAARNAGIAASSGSYIICLDADDMIGADLLERMVRPLKRRSDVDVVICDMDEYIDASRKFQVADWVVDDSKIPSLKPFKASDIDNFYQAACGYSTNKMIRKSLYDKYDLKWQEIPMHDDLALVQSALSLANKVFFVNKSLYHHRRTNDGTTISESQRNTSYDAIFIALDELKARLAKFDIWDDYKNSFYNYALDQCRWKYFDVNPDTRKSVHECLKDVWFEKLGLTDVEDDVFTSKRDLAWMKSVLDSDDIVAFPSID